MRMKGLEPPRPKTLDPKSNAATNYATCAVFGCKGSAIILFLQIYFFVRNIVGSRPRLFHLRQKIETYLPLPGSFRIG